MNCSGLQHRRPPEKIDQPFRLFHFGAVGRHWALADRRRRLLWWGDACRRLWRHRLLGRGRGRRYCWRGTGNGCLSLFRLGGFGGCQNMRFGGGMQLWRRGYFRRQRRKPGDQFSLDVSGVFSRKNLRDIGRHRHRHRRLRASLFLACGFWRGGRRLDGLRRPRGPGRPGRGYRTSSGAGGRGHWFRAIATHQAIEHVVRGAEALAAQALAEAGHKIGDLRGRGADRRARRDAVEQRGLRHPRDAFLLDDVRKGANPIGLRDQPAAGDALARIDDVQPVVRCPEKRLPVLVVQQPEFWIKQRVDRLMVDFERHLLGRRVHRHCDHAPGIAGVRSAPGDLVHQPDPDIGR